MDKKRVKNLKSFKIVKLLIILLKFLFLDIFLESCVKYCL